MTNLDMVVVIFTYNIMTVDTKKNSFKIEKKKKNSVSQLYLGILFFTMKNHL
jgi:hypothetical protein